MINKNPMLMSITKKFFGLAILALLCSFSFASVAGSLSGTIEVKKKGGRRALDSFEHAVVYLTPKGHSIAAKPSKEAVIVDQKDKLFFPRVKPIVKGQEVHFYNQDELDHNVFSTEEKNRFDLGRFPKGDFRPVTYDKTGNYKVYCNIHQNMILDIVVLDNHYFTTTDEQGNYKMDNVPPGDYTLNVWHIYGGSESKEVTVGSGALAVAPLTVVSTKVIREIQKHKNKHGKSYKKNRGRYRR